MSDSYLKYKSILFYISNEQSFIKCTIDNNIVYCENKIICSDIESKHFKIKHMSFYVFLQTYGINNHDPNHILYDSVINLPFDLLPVYKKDDDFNTFVKLFTSFSTLSTTCYDTKKYEKHIPDFTSIEKCKMSVIENNTNKEFSNFNQRIYHAGSNDNLLEHGVNIVKSIFNYNDVGTVSEKEIINTLSYMFDYLKRGIMVGIKKNKIVLFLPFSKHNYENDYYEELYFDKNDKKKLQQLKKQPNNTNLHKQLENTVKYYFKKHKINSNDVIWDRRKWFANNCFFRYDNYEGDKLLLQYLDMLIDVCNNRQINDCVFMLNLRDFPILRKDKKHPYSHIINKSIPDVYKKNNFCPVFSLGSSEHYDDIPLITQDDWRIISQKYYPEKCTNEYMIDDIIPVKWSDKKSMAIFRGAASGCGITFNTNMRLKATAISKHNPLLLDAGLTSFNKRIKKIPNDKIDSINTFNVKRKEFMSYNEKLKYKYILNIDGHVTAFRLGHELQMNSVILLVKSHYYIWFMPYLKPYEHYVPIKCDLSDLIDRINWCKKNDDKCKKIVENANRFYKKYMTLDGAYDYMASKLNNIILYNDEKCIEKIAVIVFYDGKNYENMILYNYKLNKMLINKKVNYKILIVESKENEFMNIGFNYISNIDTFDNYIFTNVSDIKMLQQKSISHSSVKTQFSATPIKIQYENIHKNCYHIIVDNK